MSAYKTLAEKMADIQDLKGIIALLHWDQEVMMPEAGGAARARLISEISGLQHQRFLDEAGPLLEKAEKEAEENPDDELVHANLRMLRRDIEKTKKLPLEHVIQSSKTSAEAFQVWSKAKAESNFELFRPKLEKVLEMQKATAEYLGYTDNIYDPLLDTFEPGMTTAKVRQLFDTFKGELLSLLEMVRSKPQVDDGFLNQHVAGKDQLNWVRPILDAVGFNFYGGRLDLSVHPFSTSISPGDVRITTRIQETDLRDMLYSTLHEAGHAMYEQGLRPDYFGMPTGTYCSLAIHESQSRLWENNIGRQLSFCEYIFPSFASLYPDHLAGKGPMDLYKAVNKVGSNLIRIESDELTYHFHIILRFELEVALMNGDLEVKDLPEAWNEKIKSYLGLDVPDDARGVLQDIHWSHGSIGYFPTYSLGSFYGAQFVAKANEELGDLEAGYRKGDFRPLLKWLRENIHHKGQTWFAEELCTKVTGEPLNVQYFIDYARDKYSRVYG